MDIPDPYKGREQAYFKHRLLEAYLERLFMIIGQHQSIISYVDCFAGPWQEHGANLEDTSIAISLNIIEKCRDGLHRFGKDVRFRALFVEQKVKSFQRLKNYLEGQKEKGIVEFMEASEKLELVQKKTRALAKQDERIQRSKQFEIFPADKLVNDNRAKLDLTEVKDYWLTRLPSEPKRFDIPELADMLEETEWFPGDFQKALGELVNEGKARNLDAKRARLVNTVNFEKGETLVRVQP